ncbi:MAG: nucleotide exchange factor GrpE [Aestuariivita sp.]|nr:nucleotide exchange factor GrpE [Aestuariivita sp.]MCY4202558.1 nucleotide exchange factor GrpE [Aestuariivita sp.]MCY4289252.1 nucleotide exchange factor GrpE [Aestuariivita sp.]MCY4347379.1 nucleotide exchange factor GrpE [Aestuariivita sp.]
MAEQKIADLLSDDDTVDTAEPTEVEADNHPDDADAGKEAAAVEVDEVESLAAERDDFKDKFYRALAESENIRKRAEKARIEAERYGSSRFIRDMLPVYDNLKRALEAREGEQGEAATALIEGVELTLRELLKVFERHGLEVLSPKPGDTFDPKVHEAIFEAPVADTKAGEIIEVSAEGFLLHDRLLRPAKVGVSTTTK